MFNLSINFEKLRLDLLPKYKELIPLLKVLTTPAVNTYYDFHEFRNKTTYQLKHNSQVIYLRKVLNDRFNTNLITIIDGVNLPETYLYDKIEASPLVLYDKSENEAETVLYDRSEYEVTTDFFIQVPATLNITPAQLIELEGLVNYYKLPNKNFEIQIT